MMSVRLVYSPSCNYFLPFIIFIKKEFSTMPIAITQENFEKIITQGTKPIVLDVYASWCGPCQLMSPIIDELESEMTAVVFAKLNVDEAREISNHYGVSSVPTFIFIKNNTILARETGFIGKQQLQQRIKNVFNL